MLCAKDTFIIFSSPVFNCCSHALCEIENYSDSFDLLCYHFFVSSSLHLPSSSSPGSLFHLLVWLIGLICVVFHPQKSNASGHHSERMV